MNIIYVRSDGFIGKKITNATHIPDDMDGFTPVVINTACNVASCYYDDGQIKLKKTMDIIAPSTGMVGDVIEITGIPNDAEVLWPDRVKTIESESVSFDATTQGRYVFVISHAHYATARVIIDVA